MRIKELMTPNPGVCTEDTSLQRVAKMMVDCDCGAIPVVESDNSKKPTGIITDRDIVTRSLARGENPLQMQARSVMTPSTVTVNVDEDSDKAVQLMRDNKVRRLVVLENDSIGGILSQADLARADAEKAAELVEEVSEPSEKASQPSPA